MAGRQGTPVTLAVAVALCVAMHWQACLPAAGAASPATTPTSGRSIGIRSMLHSQPAIHHHRRQLFQAAAPAKSASQPQGQQELAPAKAAAAASDSQQTQQSAQSHVALPADENSIVTNATAKSFLAAVATPQENAVLFTTFTLGTDEAVNAMTLDMLRNFCHYQQLAGLLAHTLLLTVDESSWRKARAAGLPAVWDQCFDWKHPGGTPNRIFDVQKHWWGMRLIELGFHAVYLDSDNMVLGDLLAAFSYRWDVQGLSDWVQPELLPTGSTVNQSCQLYFNVREERVALRSELRAYWHEPQDRQAELKNATNPCQSTGLWLLRPTPMTVRFMQALAHRLMWEGPWQWDQTAWNDVIMSFLWAMGDDGLALRYRILPHSQFSNIDVYEGRKREGLPVNQVVLHAGYVHGEDKVARYKAIGLWHPEAFVLRHDPGVVQASVLTSPSAQGSQGAAATTTAASGDRLLGLLSYPSVFAVAAMVAVSGGVLWWGRKRGGGGVHPGLAPAHGHAARTR